MSSKQKLLLSAVAGVVALGIAQAAEDSKAPKEKCYGIAKAGQNAKGTCEQLGGKSTSPDGKK